MRAKLIVILAFLLLVNSGGAEVLCFHMLRRPAQPREIVHAILFLGRDDASFITAAELPVDGGYLGMGPEGPGWGANWASR